MNRRSYLANQPDRRCRLFAGAVGIFEKFRNIFKACCRITLLSCLFLFNSNFHECFSCFFDFEPRRWPESQAGACGLINESGETISIPNRLGTLRRPARNSWFYRKRLELFDGSSNPDMAV
jgi:hypothetical protein